MDSENKKSSTDDSIFSSGGDSIVAAQAMKMVTLRVLVSKGDIVRIGTTRLLMGWFLFVSGLQVKQFLCQAIPTKGITWMFHRRSFANE